MAPRRGTSIAVEDQQEIASQDLPVSKAIVAGTNIHRTPDGREIPTGYYNPDAVSRQPGRAHDKPYDSLVQSMRLRHEATGIQPATILNFLPIPLVVNSPMPALKVRVAPAHLEGDGFSFHVWHEPSIEVMERGEGIRQPWDFHPIQLAKAFLDEYSGFGGVVMFRGLPTEEYLSRPDVAQLIADAKQAMIAWMLAKVEEANGEWNTVNRSGARNIVELHRICAMRLKDLGIIDELPEWITEARKLNDVAKKCFVCQTIPKPGSLTCLECQTILDPAKAYIANLISETDPSLERLTRAEVEALGISLFVAETADERDERVRRGDPKPLSVAQIRALQAQEMEIQRPAASGNHPPAI